jgi:hypothetical protein
MLAPLSTNWTVAWKVLFLFKRMMVPQSFSARPQQQKAEFLPQATCC